MCEPGIAMAGAGDLQPKHSTCGVEDVIKASRTLRERGNQAFAAHDWKVSIQHYTQALRVLLRWWKRSPDDAIIKQELVLACSSRAEARLRLRHFEEAVGDACRALQLDPSHLKSLYRRGEALLGLHNYQEAACCFEEALNMLTHTNSSNNSRNSACNDKKLKEALKASHLCHRQATTGEFDLARQICIEVELGRKPTCGEFIGPVVIAPASNKALGRGLIVTQDVECGQLLLVSLAIAHANSKSPYEDLATQLAELAMASERLKNQVNSLASPDVIPRIPSMDLFAPNTKATRPEDVDIAAAQYDACGVETNSNVMDKMLGVALTNAFKQIDDDRATLWLLPSFINHSCTPNACWLQVSDEVLFVRAARHLRKGEEVTISYLYNPLVPYFLRAVYCEGCRTFECRCERCAFERSVQTITRPLEDNFFTDVITGASSAAAKIVGTLEHAFQQNPSKMGNEKQRQWLYASFAEAYLMMSRGNRRSALIPSWQTVLRAIQSTVGGLEFMVLERRDIIVALGSSKGSIEERHIIGDMCVCLYGTRDPTALQAILDMRARQTGPRYCHLN